MQTKYTILKALIQNSNKNPGFTLLELIVGLSIMVLVGGFAMNAFVDSSKTFSNDKKNIDSIVSVMVCIYDENKVKRKHLYLHIPILSIKYNVFEF